jgi:hypothetical protein
MGKKINGGRDKEEEESQTPLSEKQEKTQEKQNSLCLLSTLFLTPSIRPRNKQNRSPLSPTNQASTKKPKKMAPKAHAETYLTEERLKELKEHFEAHGIDMRGIRAADVEYLDRALQSGWKAPKKSTLEHELAAMTTSRAPKNIRTLMVHQAREHLGEPVGQKQQA